MRITFELRDDMPQQVPVICHQTGDGRIYYILPDLTLTEAIIMLNAAGDP